MMVRMTSLTRSLFFKKPANIAQRPPPIMPATKHSGTWINHGRPLQYAPTSAAGIAPAMIWPSIPILNMPPRAANAMARPAKISGVAVPRVWAMLSTLPNAPVNIALYPSMGEYPAIIITNPATNRDRISEITERKTVFCVSFSREKPFFCFFCVMPASPPSPCSPGCAPSSARPACARRIRWRLCDPQCGRRRAPRSCRTDASARPNRRR